MILIAQKREAPRAGEAEIEKSKKTVIRNKTAIRNLTNTFEVADKSKLYNLVSCAPVPPCVEINVMKA